jgi:hypothetical protein
MARHLLTLYFARVTVLLNDLLERPQDIYSHMRRLTSSIATILVFGQRATSYEDFWGHVCSHLPLCAYAYLTGNSVCTTPWTGYVNVLANLQAGADKVTHLVR